MRTVAIVLLSLLAFSANGADRSTKIKALMEAQGLLQMWDQQMVMGRQQARAQAQQVLDQALASLSPPPEFDARFRDAFDEYMKNMEAAWTAQDVVNVWAEKYGARFTDQELDGLVAYYTSPLGRKDVAATQAAMPEFMGHFAELSKPIAEKATQSYIQSLQKAVQDCRCKKK